MRTEQEKPIRIKPPICDCKQGHNIITPVIGYRCRKCGAEEKSWEVVRSSALMTLEHENAILINALWEIRYLPGDRSDEYYSLALRALRQVEG